MSSFWRRRDDAIPDEAVRIAGEADDSSPETSSLPDASRSDKSPAEVNLPDVQSSGVADEDDHEGEEESTHSTLAVRRKRPSHPLEDETVDAIPGLMRQMSENRLGLLGLLALLALGIGWFGRVPLPPGTRQVQAIVNDRSVPYLLHVPAATVPVRDAAGTDHSGTDRSGKDVSGTDGSATDRSHRWPVVVVLVGGPEKAAHLEAVSRLSEQADQHGFAVIYVETGALDRLVGSGDGTAARTSEAADMVLQHATTHHADLDSGRVLIVGWKDGAAAAAELHQARLPDASGLVLIWPTAHREGDLRAIARYATPGPLPLEGLDDPLGEADAPGADGTEGDAGSPPPIVILVSAAHQAERTEPAAGAFWPVLEAVLAERRLETSPSNEEPVMRGGRTASRFAWHDGKRPVVTVFKVEGRNATWPGGRYAKTFGPSDPVSPVPDATDVIVRTLGLGADSPPPLASSEDDAPQPQRQP